MTCMNELDLFDHIDLDKYKLESYLNEIESSYQKSHNPYHNSLHAADIVQTIFHLCSRGRLINASGKLSLSLSLFLSLSIYICVFHLCLEGE
jgi:calcium/calmodulin-dependent 3',5'-cyclic nucleotide phosphodiesterase